MGNEHTPAPPGKDPGRWWCVHCDTDHSLSAEAVVCSTCNISVCAQVKPCPTDPFDAARARGEPPPTPEATPVHEDALVRIWNGWPDPRNIAAEALGRPPREAAPVDTPDRVGRYLGLLARMLYSRASGWDADEDRFLDEMDGAWESLDPVEVVQAELVATRTPGDTIVTPGRHPRVSPEAVRALKAVVEAGEAVTGYDDLASIEEIPGRLFLALCNEIDNGRRALDSIEQ